MLIAAQIQNDIVTNIIYINQANMELFAAQGMELMDSAPLGLTIGDYRESETWYRDVEGTKTALPLPAPPNPSYNDLLTYYNSTGEEISQ